MSMPAKVMLIDLETQSAVDIKNIHLYVKHPSTRILCATGKVQGEPPVVWIPPGRCPKDFNQLNSKYLVHCGSTPPFPTNIPWVAHNAFGFDRLVWENLGYPSPVDWIDTIPLCRANGYPAALEKVSQVLFGEGKNKDGSDIIKLLCKATQVGSTYRYPIGTIALWEALLDYNVRDVELLERLYNIVAPNFYEWELLRVDQEINRRGIRFDVKLCSLLLQLWDQVRDDSFDLVERLTDGALKGTDLQSTYKVKKWMVSKGVVLDSLDKHTLTEELAEYDSEDCPHLETVKVILDARQNATRSSKGKIERLLGIAAVAGERLQHGTVFHGAHTGRWSGRGVQPHNLARPIDTNQLAAILSIYENAGTLSLADLGERPADRLTELMRPVFCADEGKTLIVGDYSQIEARCAAWLAQDAKRMAIFADPSRDMYCESASMLFGRAITKADKRERQIGKVMELGLQYGMSGPKFNVFALRSKPSVDLVAIGIDPKEAVKKWRDANKSIVEMWYACERACMNAIGQCSYFRLNNLGVAGDGKALGIQLPSGRWLWYRNARIEMRVPKFVYVLGLTPFKKPTIIYDHPHGREGILYGGLIFENIVQATCRDILADALLRCSHIGLSVVLHVHDEIVCEEMVYDIYAQQELGRLMNRVPTWANGFPMKVDIGVSERYTK